MKLYQTYASPFPTRVRLLLIAKGIAVEIVEPPGFHASTEAKGDYLKINPIGRVPTLVLDDGRALADPVLLRAYCEAIIEQNYKVFPPLFLADGPTLNDDEFGWAPPFILKQINKRWADETRRREALAA